MQDTPEFSQLLTRYQSHNEEQLLNTAPPIADANHIATIRRALQVIGQYFDEAEFRATLTTTRKRNIEGQISNILAQFEQIQQLRSSGQLAQSLESIITNIQTYLDEIDLRYTTPFQTFLLEGRKDVSSTVAAIERAQQEAERARDTAEEKLKEADLLVGQGSDIKFANLFQRLSNGMTVEQNDALLDTPRLDGDRLWKWYLVVAAVLSLIGILGANEIVDAVKNHSAEYYIRIGGLLTIPLILSMGRGHKWLNKTRPGGYERSAALWMIATALSVIGTGAYAAIIILGLGPNPGWDDLIPKIVSLLAPAFFVRLCVRNYRASKHLAVQNSHRATVSQAVGGFAGRLETSETSLQGDLLNLKGEMFLKAASLTFDPGETGFISRGEGAGTSDNFFDEHITRPPQIR